MDMREANKEQIDFVIAWVDGADPAWLAQKSLYDGEQTSDDRDVRYRDWDTLRYWFRGVERFAPWVRTIHFVTWGHLPAWLDTTNPKLHIVNHRDFIPEKYLPTFSSHTIDLNLHRIPGLSERFVYFNDDMFLLKETCPEVFFKNGLPCDAAVHIPMAVNRTDRFFAPMTNVAVLNSHFKMRECIKSNLGKWLNPLYGKNAVNTALLLPYSRFFGFCRFHLPNSFLRSTFDEVWSLEPDILDETSSHRIRINTDVNQWLFEWWQLASGKFTPRSPKVGKAFGIAADGSDGVEEAARYISRQVGYMVCVNDGAWVDDFEAANKAISAAFESILPERSSFEREGA